MRYVWLALAFVAVLVVSLLVGIVLGRGEGGEQGRAAPSPRTVTVEKTVPARTSSSTTTASPAASTPPTTTPTGSVNSLDQARAAFEQAVRGYGNPSLEASARGLRPTDGRVYFHAESAYSRRIGQFRYLRG